MFKKLLFTVLSCLMLFALVACNDEVSSDSTETYEIVIPWNGSSRSVSGSRGLTNMLAYTPFNTNNPESDLHYSQAVMQCMPIFTGLETVEVSSSASISDLNLGYEMFGYTCSPDTEKSRVNDDGVYVRYNVLEGDNHIGVIEYYYNKDTNRLSYREYAMLTATVNTGSVDVIVDPAILVFSIDDVELGDNNELAANQLYTDSNGKTKLKSKEAYVDMHFLKSGEDGPYFERRIMTLSSDGNLTCSFSQPWNSISIVSASSMPDALTTIIDTAAGGSDPGTVTVANKDNFTADTALAFVAAAYANGSYASRGGWEDYDDFTARNLWEMTYVDADNMSCTEWSGISTPTHTNTMWVSYFKLSNVATVETRGNRAYYNSSIYRLDKDDENYVESYYSGHGFDTVFDTLSSTYDSNPLKQVINKLLPECGITDTNFISAFVTKAGAATSDSLMAEPTI